MSNRGDTGKLVDEILRFAATAGAVASAVVVPNVLIVLQKPLAVLYKTLDAREHEREVRRVLYYMKSQGYLTGAYDHGLQLTAKARERLRAIQLDDLKVVDMAKWDHFWRLVMYDIPEDLKGVRNAFHDRLRQIGCFQLQRSVWITPFPCRDVVSTIAATYKVDTYVTYFEARNLDNEATMLSYFRKKYPTSKF